MKILMLYLVSGVLVVAAATFALTIVLGTIWYWFINVLIYMGSF
jgi:hypothetical protein